MRLESLKLRGLSSAFPDVVDLSLRDLPAGLIAIGGANGQGKTMLLESTPALLYRQLPARDGKDPVLFAIDRECYIEQEFSIDGRGAFRARLSLDGPKRQSDAVLEQAMGLGPDVLYVPLNDGKRSTYDAAIKERFPSFDLFINSAFAAQGRGDEFTRRKPSQRKDLFAEFLALQHYAAKAKAATAAGELCDDARLRLSASIEVLERDTAAAITADLDRQANQLQADGGAAEVRQRELKAVIEDLEARTALLADQVTAYAAAQHQLQTVERDLAARRAERSTITTQRQRVVTELVTETTTITAKRTAAVTDAANKIAGNQQLQEKRAEIQGAVAGLALVEASLRDLRGKLTATTELRNRLEADRRRVEQQLAHLAPIDERLIKSRLDATLLDTVPCAGAGPYAACQFLVNATAAAAQIEALEQQLRPKAELADQVAACTRDLATTQAEIDRVQEEIRRQEAQQATHQQLTKYVTPLAESTARVQELQGIQSRAEQDAADALAAAQRRHDARLEELTVQAATLDTTIAALEQSRAGAEATLAAAAGDNSQAAQLQAELTAARREWDTVTGTIARVASGRDFLERRRAEIVAKRAQLADLQARAVRIDQERLEWKDLAKALGKGGLPDLEIDQAGPTISATTNAILLDCFGPRFSIELVTQVEKADGGMKDEFTVRVLDNERAGGWRDISDLSGGQKVIVQEVLMCSISIFVNERSPMPIRTLWRDETGAALDPENAVRYVQMLRKVRDLGGYHHIFFISHNAECRALADAQIVVGNGRALVVLPPFEEAA